MALIKARELNDLVRQDVMKDPVLSNIDEETRQNNVNLVLTLTNPAKNGMWYDSKSLAEVLFKFRFNAVPNRSQKRAMHLLILRAVKHPTINLQQGIHYQGGPIETYGPNNDRYKLSGTLEIQGEAISQILLGFVFQNEYQNDQFCANFLRCFTAVFMSYRKHNEAARSLRDKKNDKIMTSRVERGAMQAQVAAQGVNPQFGILAHVDKLILGKIAPGPGSQKEKIARARDEETLVSGSACKELNPTEQGLRAALLARCAHAVATDEQYLQSPNTEDGKKVKRQRIVDVSKSALSNFGNLTYPNTTVEQNLRMVYNPAEAVKAEVALLD